MRPLDQYATDTLANLDGFTGLKPTGNRAYPAQYPAAIATADGKLSSSGVPQRLTLVVLRREGLATYPVLATHNAKVSSPFVRQVEAIIHSLRGRPVEGSGYGAKQLVDRDQRPERGAPGGLDRLAAAGEPVDDARPAGDLEALLADPLDRRARSSRRW